jgi:DNA polymerase, archaea type
LDSKKNNNNSPLIKEYKFVSRYERIIDSSKSIVLQLTLFDSTKALTLAKRIERLGGSRFGFGKHRIYNVDIQPAQAYFYENNIFPLALCDVYYYQDKDKNNNKLLKIVNIDNIWNTNCVVPQFKSVFLEVNAKKINDNNSSNKIIGHSNAINSKP